WSDFEAAAGALSTAATALEEAGASGDMGSVKAAFGNVGKSCGGCHKSFRKDD
ncbi:MAG: cytochrome c, partial [Myxococcota bacterium]